MNRKQVRVGLVFKDFACWLRTSCTGLNVAGFATAQVLKQAGVEVAVFPVRHNIDIVNEIDGYFERTGERLTHVIISAPWLSEHDLKALLNHFPYIQFVILSHSNVGFLQADFEGVRLLRKYIHLSKEYFNLHVGGNTERFVDWLRDTYHENAVLLPNLYPIDRTQMKPVPLTPGGTRFTPDQYQPNRVVKIGAFGALRPQKNFMTAAASAVLIQRYLGMPIEFHMSSDGEGDTCFTAQAIEQLLEGSGVTLVRHPWRYWDDFVQVVSGMDLLIQVSYTESFNMVTADGISVGVPSVVSPAITWAPQMWTADPDNPGEVASVGISLLTQDETRQLGIGALNAHNKWAVKVWKKFLDVPEHHHGGGVWQTLRRLFESL